VDDFGRRVESSVCEINYSAVFFIVKCRHIDDLALNECSRDDEVLRDRLDVERLASFRDKSSKGDDSAGVSWVWRPEPYK
jgi:hypothetical protein